MTLDRRYLKRRGETWYLKLPIPRGIRHLYKSASGRERTHVEEALGTRDLATANRLKHARLAHWTREFAAKEREAAGTLPVDIAEARTFRQSLRQARDDRDVEAEEDAADERARQIEESAGYDRAKQFYDLATSRRETLQEAWEKWMAVNEHNAATKLKDKQAFQGLLDFLGVADAVPSVVTGAKAREYVDWLNASAVSARGGPLSKATKEGRIAPLRIFWNDYLAHHELVPDGFNPWRNPKLTGRRKSTEEQPDKKRKYTEDEILALLNGPELRASKGVRYPKRTLMEVYALCFFTGARIGEIANRRLGDVEKISGGYLLHIRTGKTDDALRSIPIYHPIPVAVLKGRIGKRTDKKAQLFAEFIPGGPNGSLGWYVSKALGHYRDRVGLGTATDTHSTRRQLISLLHAKEVPEVLAMQYTGHRPKGMTGVYAEPEQEAMRSVARAIRYPAKIERAFQTTLAGQGT